MVHVSHPTVFSLADFPEPASCAARPLLLEGGAHLLVVLAFLFHLLPVVESGTPVTVVCGGEETYTHIHTHHLLRLWRVW